MRADKYQIALIVLGVFAVAFFSIFLRREIFPEYRIYQNDYIALEKFRSSYTGEPVPPFTEGVKQIVIEREDRGPPTIDRCISCHVALQITDFSPTKIARDINGNIILNEQGIPVKVANENYIWEKLDQKIAQLSDKKVLENLSQQGKAAEANRLAEEAKKLEGLKTVTVNGRTYEVSKVLSMHPLIGKETRPFEFHPLEEYGCTSCHNGNGRGLTAEKAHGPVFDDQYDIEYSGPHPNFTEKDPKNDPPFARMYNHKPGNALLFQTTPIFSGPVIQAKCLQCHQSSSEALESSSDKKETIIKNLESRSLSVKKAFETEKNTLISLIQIRNQVKKDGLTATLENLEKEANNYQLPIEELDRIESQIKYIKGTDTNDNTVLRKLDHEIQEILGNPTLIEAFNKESEQESDPGTFIDKFIQAHKDEQGEKGSLFRKARAWNAEKELLRHVDETQNSVSQTVSDQKNMEALLTDIDLLTGNYHKGRELFFTHACYACHRITGISHASIGPDLTFIGNTYPWYIKESIVWPQADLKTSTMPNQLLDHEDLQDLVTYLLGQTGKTKAKSEIEQKISVQKWEAGKRQPWEQPISPNKIVDLRYGMTVFAAEGCASCHRLKGYESNVGYAVEKDKDVTFDKLYKEREWFTHLFPENILGSQIVKNIEEHSEEIDQRVNKDVRKGSILEELEEKYPGLIATFYSNFKFASRAKNNEYQQKIGKIKDENEKDQLELEHKKWKDRVKTILMLYIQEYGFGNLIGPRPNWSGIFRTNEWLLLHFRNPTEYAPRTIMPPFPFDDTKFESLIFMLDKLAIQNTDQIREIWQQHGFNAEQAAHILCSQCHGELLIGNGPVAEWIYPVPKNLRNADFLRNLTKERAIQSITHGVKGTPMPPWGEIAKDKTNLDNPVLNQNEIQLLVDWLFSAVPGGNVIQTEKDVPKWQYSPKDFIEELRKENEQVQIKPPQQKKKSLEEELHRENVTKQKTAQKEEIAILEIIDNQYVVKPDKTEEIFEVIPNQHKHDPDQNLYYIKKDFYTPENIQIGKQFFELNCAPCHGKEADGTGIRAEVMHDAKPRMLTNLDWIETRDDLRLLRSIKFGVPGTSMTPWGDFTSPLQRLQLVVFIRSLSEKQKLSKSLAENLYHNYDFAELAIEEARIPSYNNILELQAAYDKLKNKRTILSEYVVEGTVTSEELKEIYQEELKVQKKLNQEKEIDHYFRNLKDLIEKEREVYQKLGEKIFSNEQIEKADSLYLELVDVNRDKLTLQDKKFIMHWDKEQEEKISQLGKQIVEILNERIDGLEQEKKHLEGQMPTPRRKEELDYINRNLASLLTLKQTLISNLQEAVRIREEETQTFRELEKKLQKRE